MYYLVLNLSCIIVGLCILCVLASWCAPGFSFINSWIFLRSELYSEPLLVILFMRDVSFK